MPMAPLAAQFPAPLQVLFVPKQFKVLWGGRGAGRSWGVARALLLKGAEGSSGIRVLCVRELQNSIGDSVHKVLSDQIAILGLQGFYEIQVSKIVGRNGTIFSFEGIKNNTNRIRSYEGIDYCWVEEANKVSKNSWSVLIPTIRKKGSEIWVTFNPELETDYTYVRFVKDPDLVAAPLGRFGQPITGTTVYESDLSFVVKMTYRDNPWFDETSLVPVMERDKRDERNYDTYLNVWEGFCLQVLEGAVYAKELRRALEDGRIGKVPWEGSLPVNTAWDLGRADNTSIWFFQRVGMQWRVVDFFEASGEGDVGFFLKELQTRPYVYGSHFLPHDAKAKRLGTKKSVQEMISAAYPGRVQIVPRLSLVDGINAARVTLGSCWIDEDRCTDGLNRLRHYQYKVVNGQRSNEPLHDEASDAADAFRYMALSMKSPQGGSAVGVMERLRRKAASAFAPAPSGGGWLG